MEKAKETSVNREKVLGSARDSAEPGAVATLGHPRAQAKISKFGWRPNRCEANQSHKSRECDRERDPQMDQPSGSTVDQKGSSTRKRSMLGSNGGQWESDTNQTDDDRKGEVKKNEWMD